MGLSANLRIRREEIKMTQKELAQKIGVEPATISKYESGMNEPNIKNLKSIAEALDTSIDELVKEEEDVVDLSKVNLLEVLREQKRNKLEGNIYHYTQVKFAYNTNHIEGSTLTEEQTRYIYETKSLLTDQNTLSFTKLDDIYETVNHFRLVDYMIENADKKLTESMIKEFHKILKAGTSDETEKGYNIGEYKSIENSVGNLKTAKPNQVAKEINVLLEKYNSKEKVKVEDIIDFHAKFEAIHPFQDGNGRVGRAIMFKECLKNNIIPFIILDKDKQFYYRGLYQYQESKEKGYLIDTCLNAQDQYKAAMEYFLKGYTKLNNK